jgi:tRNA uridine 5-carbamoylmethylation protein Kti12
MDLEVNIDMRIKWKDLVTTHLIVITFRTPEFCIKRNTEREARALLADARKR